MKKIALIAVFAGLVFCGCNHRKTVDETVETDRYTLHIQDLKSYKVDHPNLIVSNYFTSDTTVLTITIPELAMHLAAMTRGPHLDSVMFYVDMDKQNILPKYVYTIVDRDTTQPKDYTPLMQALVDRGILRIDTTYEPRQLLVIFDSTRLNSFRKMEADLESTNTLSMAVQMQQKYRKPIVPGPGVELDIMTDGHIMGNGWTEDSLWLDERGLRIIPDPQGSPLRILTFNRAKGSI